MSMDCEPVRRALGAWLDGEVSQREAQEIHAHVEQCPSCRDLKTQLERIHSSLHTALEARASEVPFESFWHGVQRRIDERSAWHLRYWDWLREVFFPRRLAWAIPLTIVFFVAILSAEQLLSKLGWGPSNSNLAAVELIDGHGLNVALFREAETKTTVIWLFESQEEEDEPLQESSAADAAL